MQRKAIQLEEFSTAQQFVDRLESLKNSDPRNWVFRGHADADWGLKPTFFRQKVVYASTDETRADHIVRAEQETLKKFISKAMAVHGRELNSDWWDSKKRMVDSYIRAPHRWPPEDLFKYLALAQHYGVPTRLLDWTREPLIATFFAAQGAVERCMNDAEISLNINEVEGKNLCVWAFNIGRIAELNQTDNAEQIVKVISLNDVDSPFENKNLDAQKGLFTVIRQSVQDGQRDFSFQGISQLDDLVESRGLEGVLYQFSIPRNLAPEVLRYCEMKDVDASSVYPDLYGAAQYAADKRKVFCMEELLNEYENGQIER